MFKRIAIMIVACTGLSFNAAGQTILFDGAEAGVPTNATDFSFMGSSWTGGFVATQGVLALYASGLFSYHVEPGPGSITFNTPVEIVTFFYVHGSGFSAGTATAFHIDSEAGDIQVDSASSNLATTFNDLANFVTLTSAMGIDRIDISAGVIDNFSFTALPVQPGLADPIPRRIPKGGITVELQTFAEGLTSPLGVKFPGSDASIAYVYDQVGFIHIVESGVVTGTLLDVTGRTVVPRPGFDERGLLGLALHPDFASNGLIYTYTSEPISGPADFTVAISGSFDHQAVFAEWEVVAGVVDTGTRRELLRIDEPQFNHDGGAIEFGSDGYLYIALGDGGAADDDADGHGVNGNGQDTSNVLGTLLRIDVDVDGSNTPSANGNYEIPTDNPFVGVAGVDEIFAYGFRNPYQFSFDQSTDALILADVGQNDIEEVNIVTLGGNYGWRVKEGSFTFDANGVDSGFVTTGTAIPGLIDPIAEYDHDEGTSIIGGFVYRGPDADLFGKYITGDFSVGFSEPGGRLFFLDDSDEFVELSIGLGGVPLGLFIKGFAQDPQGNVYVCGSKELAPVGSTGVVLKIVSISASLPSSNSASIAVLMLALAAAGATLLRWRLRV